MEKGERKLVQKAAWNLVTILWITPLTPKILAEEMSAVMALIGEIVCVNRVKYDSSNWFRCRCKLQPHHRELRSCPGYDLGVQ